MMKTKFLASAFVLSVAIGAVAGVAYAADPVLQRVPGVIQAVRGDMIDVSTSSGIVHTTMTPQTTVAVVTHAHPRDLKPGVFIGSTAARQPDGSFKAMEVHVFPESMRGAGQGNYPWEGPQVTMTNGAVAVLKGTKGRMMTVDYGTGTKDIMVPTSVPIVNIGPAQRSQVVKGAQVLVVGTPAGSGPLPANYVILGSPGVKPPM